MEPNPQFTTLKQYLKDADANVQSVENYLDAEQLRESADIEVEVDLDKLLEEIEPERNLSEL